MFKKLFNIFNNLKFVQTPEVVFLIGLPGSGKSSYIKKQRDENKCFQKYAICSTDHYIESMAAIQGKKYHEAFDEFYPEAEKNFFEHIDVAVKNNFSLFIDRTNVSSTDRKQILDKIPSHYIKRAVVFHLPQEELKKRLLKREETTGKVITDEVLIKMIAKYEHPTYQEFDKMERAYNRFSDEI